MGCHKISIAEIAAGGRNRRSILTEHEVCNQQFDRCPGCGQYKGQYHNSECPYLKKEQNDHGCQNSEQDKDVEGTD